MLVTVIHLHGVFLVDFVLDAGSIAHFMDAEARAAVIHLDVGIGFPFQALLVVFHLNARAQVERVFAVHGVDFRRVCPRIQLFAVPLVQHVFRAVSAHRRFLSNVVLALLAQRNLERAEFLVQSGRKEHTMTIVPMGIRGANLDVFGLFFVVVKIFCHFSLRLGEGVVTNELVAGLQLQPFRGLINSVEANGPAFELLRIVLQAEFRLESNAPLLVDFLLQLNRRPHAEVVALCRSNQRGREKGEKQCYFLHIQFTNLQFILRFYDFTI